MGDSPIRETATNIMMQFHKKDEYGFHHMDLSLTQVLLDTTTLLSQAHSLYFIKGSNWTDYPLRITYEFWNEMFDFEAGQKRNWGVCKPLLDHFNFIGHTSTFGFEHEGGNLKKQFLILILI